MEIITSLLAERRTNFEGKHYQIVDAPLDPKPIQTKVPLLIGGGGRKRTLKTTARFADEWNYWGMPKDIRDLCEVLDAHCSDLGRDPKEISRSAVALMFISEDENL